MEATQIGDNASELMLSDNCTHYTGFVLEFDITDLNDKSITNASVCLYLKSQQLPYQLDRKNIYINDQKES